MPHCDGLRLGVHQHLMPAVEDNRLVIRMADLATDKDLRVSTLRHPMQVTQLRLTADQLLMLPRRQSIRMLHADVNELSANPDELLAEVRLARTPAQWLVSQDQQVREFSLNH